MIEGNIQVSRVHAPSRDSHFFEPLGSWNGPLVEVDTELDAQRTDNGSDAASADDDTILIYWG